MMANMYYNFKNAIISRMLQTHERLKVVPSVDLEATSMAFCF